MAYAGHRIPAATCSAAPRPRSGSHSILGSLELGRINIAARAVGVARAAFDAAMRYAHERETFGMPIVQHQAIQFKLADMATKLEAARLLVQNAAERKFEPAMRADVEAGMAKLFARRRRSSWPPRRCGSTAATATRPTSRSSATSGTRR